jgi:hypothetical protein
MQTRSALQAGRGARDVAHARVPSSNRAADGGGWIVDPDGAAVALTQQTQQFIRVELDFSAIRAPAGARGQTTQSSAASRGVA